MADVLKEWKAKTDGINLFSVKDIKKSHATACRRAGITDFKIHDCRHTAATLYRQLGVRLDMLKDILGHSNINMTMRYAHIGDDEKSIAAQKLGRSVVD